jgi:hypothetical protein
LFAAHSDSRRQRDLTLWLTTIALLLWLLRPMAIAGQSVSQPLQGEFAVTIATDDIPQDMIDGATLVGRWRISFNADGSYTRARQDVGTLASGRFQIDGNRLSLTDESGLLACGLATGGDPGATYEWEISDDRLRLAAIDEPCAERRLLLTTRTLAFFVSCPGATPVATPIASPPTTPLASPAATPIAAVTTPDAAIDQLLARMSACWATSDPDRFLPLLSADYQASLLSNGADGLRQLLLAMSAPIVWDRVGDVEPIDVAHAVATVRQTSGDEIDYVRYRFSLAGDAWRWDGFAATPATPVP